MNENDKLTKNIKYLIMAANHSKYNAHHWFRYLRKFIKRNEVKISNEEFYYLYNSSELTNFQKVSLKYALDKKTLTHEYIVSLNEKTKLSNVNKLREKYEKI